MAAIFNALPAPAANGSGAAVDVSAYGGKKTIVVEGNGSSMEPFVLIEVALDAAGVNWSPLTMFHRPGEVTVTVACRWMRATVANYRGGGAPTVNVGGEDDSTVFATLVAPAGNGDGVGVDVSALPTFKTVQVTDAFKGCVTIEVSNDGGATYSLAMAFLPNTPGIQSAELVGQFMRVNRSGVSGGSVGLPIVTVAGAPVLSNALVQGLSYGDMHFHDPGTLTPVPVATVFVKAANVSHLHDASGVSMPADNRLRYDGASQAIVIVIAALSFKCSANNQVLGFAIAINGVVNTQSIIRTKITTGTDIQAVTVVSMVRYNPGDYAEVWLTDDTGPSNVTIDHGNITMQAFAI